MPTRDRRNDSDAALTDSLTIYRRLVSGPNPCDEFREMLRQLEVEAERRQLVAVIASSATAPNPRRL